MLHHLDNDLDINPFVFLYEEFSKYQSLSVAAPIHLMFVPNSYMTLVCKNIGLNNLHAVQISILV